MKIQGLRENITLAVIDLEMPFDVVLGDAWLRSRYALIDFKSGCLTVYKLCRKVRLQADLRDGKAVHTVKLPESQATPLSVPTVEGEEPMFLSAMQAKMAIEKED